MGDPTYTNFVDTVGEDCSGVRQSLQLIGHINNINDAVDFLFPPHVLDDLTTRLQRAFLSTKCIRGRVQRHYVRCAARRL
ncbi:hypothetical protein BDR05DRAFT_958474, partial [Suillus weaverae]